MVPTLLVSAIILCSAASARAQNLKSEIAVGAGVGLQFPTGEFGDRVDGNHSLYLAGDYFLNPSWAIGLRASYQTFDAVSGASVAALRRIRYLSGDAQAKLYLYPESWFTPYAAAGTGVYAERRWTGSGPSAAESDRSLVGLLGGFGLSAHRQGQKLSVFTEILYHHMLTSDTRQFVQWSAGMRISFGGRPF
jgi:hypothetical protein